MIPHFEIKIGLPMFSAGTMSFELDIVPLVKKHDAKVTATYTPVMGEIIDVDVANYSFVFGNMKDMLEFSQDLLNIYK